MDYILLEQYWVCKNNIKHFKRLHKWFPHDKELGEAVRHMENKLGFYEYCISDPTLIRKKINKLSIKRTVTKIYYAIRFIKIIKMFRRNRAHDKMGDNNG